MPNTDSSPAVPLLRMRGIRKSFGPVEVLRGVDFDVLPGEAHALVGENGAGKSTLMNILAGVHQPSRGQIDFAGKAAVVFADEKTSQAAGISIVFQERSLFAPLTVAENIFAGRQPTTRWGHIRRRALRQATQALLDRLGLRVRPQDVVAELSPAEQQMVEVAKALSLNARLVIFDEPTAALTATETRTLFAVIQSLKKDGVGIVYISHRLEELFTLVERVTVLKDGAWQGTALIKDVTTDKLVRQMVGREVLTTANSPTTPGGEPLLEVKNLSDPLMRSGRRALLDDVSLTVHAGEIVGLAGLAGAGRTELALSIFGLRRRGQGEVRMKGTLLRGGSPPAAMAAGIGYASEDRKDAGLFLELSIARNIAAARLETFGSLWYSAVQESNTASDLCERLRIACRGVNEPVRQLSGGNQQKVVLAKWLLVDPEVLIADEPTRGVDVGAKAEVHQILRQLKARGKGVLVISSDLPEVLQVCDRIVVLRAGRVAGELHGSEATEEKVLRLATIETSSSA